MARIKDSAKYVTVACKLPQGLHIRLEDGQVVKLNGSASPYAIGGYGLTQNIPADTWAAIQAQHAEAKWLVNEFVFANGDAKSVDAQAAEMAGENAGFDPIDPNKLPDAIQPDGANDPVS